MIDGMRKSRARAEELMTEKEERRPCSGSCSTQEEHVARVEERLCSALTGTLCDVDGCGLPQFRCPSGVSCGSLGGHGMDAPSDVPDPRAVPKIKKAPRIPEAPALPPPPPAAERPPRERSKGVAATETLATLPAGDLDGLVERFFDESFSRDYDRVERSLKLEGQAHRAEYKTLADALDDSTEIARLAHRLYVNARVEREVFEIDATIVLADMRAQATAVLQVEKEGGKRSKAITDADVESTMATMFPDEWRAIARRRKQVEMAVKHLEQLAEIALKRCGTTDTLVRTKR